MLALIPAAMLSRQQRRSRRLAPQVRKVRFDGQRMVLTPPASEIAGVKVTRELTWERITDQSL